MAKQKDKTLVVQVPRGTAPCQVDDFPKGCQRSVQGSLRVTSGTLLLTEGELKHLRKHHKALSRRLRVVGEHKPKEAPKDADKGKTGKLADNPADNSVDGPEDSRTPKAPKSRSAKK